MNAETLTAMDWSEDDIENLRTVQRPVSTERVTGRSGSSASSAALHEASHAVTGLSLGSRFISVTIIPKVLEQETPEGITQRLAYGCVHYDPTERFRMLSSNPEKVVFEIFAPHVTSELIGFSRVGLRPDQEQLSMLGEDIFNIRSSDDELTPEMLAWFTDMHQRTFPVVTPLLKDIVRLAEQLDLRQTLSYDEVRKLLGEICSQPQPLGTPLTSSPYLARKR